jgi:hypothetical protein
MRKYLLLITVISALSLQAVYAGGKGGGSEGSLQKKSRFFENPAYFHQPSSFPLNFDETGQQNKPEEASISTGYYFVDNNEVMPEEFLHMRPAYKFIDTTEEPNLWRKIVPGPRILPKSYWESNTKEGLAFFRNPAEDFWNDPTDSVDNAIAGPIPLGIRGGFYFNGIRYDSFYVSTNGLIALTNRRYFYDENGNRVIPAGSDNCYDPMSMDWFAGGIRGRDTLWETDANGNEIIDETGNRIPVKDEHGNQLYKNGLNDAVPDNFGYIASVLGIDPTNPGAFDPTCMTCGIRDPNIKGAINGLNPNTKPAIIAVFWGDLILSQWNPDTEKVDEHGKVFYKRTFTNDSLIVSFYNAQPYGDLVYSQSGQDTYVAPDKRPNSPGGNYVTGDAQVVLSRLDSSVTIHYRRFTDRLDISGEAIGERIFRYNTISGVYGFARHTNFGNGGVKDGGPWAGEYEQYTTYWQQYADATVPVPINLTAVKFKQWKNTLRVADIQYRVRSLDPETPDPYKFSELVESEDVPDYELLAGDLRLGAIQPVALIQNLTNDIQGPGGVNFTTQDLEFRARFRIINQITGRPIYNRIVPVDDICLGLEESQSHLCNGDPTVKVRLAESVEKKGPNYIPTLLEDFDKSGFNGVPPYYFVQVTFPPFEPNEFILNHIGRHRAYIIADPSNPRTGESIGDQWPFDDTTNVRLFVVKRISEDAPEPMFRSFDDDGTEFHVDRETGEAIPSAWRWVNIESQMVSGDDVSKYPLPPRGDYSALNSSSRILSSPVIKMNRTWGAGEFEPLARNKDERGYGGDEIRSFPIDMRGKYGSVLSISVQKTEHQEDWPRGWSDYSLIGPEPRIVSQGNQFNVYDPVNSLSNQPDELVVEFAKPSDDGISGITNIPLENWRHHPNRRGSDVDVIEDMAALTIYGGGGHLMGFLESDPDSALGMPNPTDNEINSLRYDPFDIGINPGFKKYFVQIPDTFINWKNDGAKNFRFRVKVYATNDFKDCQTCIFDDTDDFFVDNIKLSLPGEVTDLEVSKVKIDWPYTQAPASQATKIPLRVQVSNNTSRETPTFGVKVKIFRIDQSGSYVDENGNVYEKQNPDEIDPIYCRVENLPNLSPGRELEIPMPTWNARMAQKDTVGRYRIWTMLVQRGINDLQPENDSTYTDFTLRFADNFAYDPPVENPQNNVEQFYVPGKGINLWGSNFTGRGSSATNITDPHDPVTDGIGTVAGAVGSGQLAMRFFLDNSDTLRGFQAYFASLNRSADQVTFTVFRGSEQLPSTQAVLRITTTRGGPGGQNIYDRYVNYVLSNPVILESGYYWLAISQDGQDGLELGGSSSRSGMRTMNAFIRQDNVWGTAGNSLMLDEQFRKLEGNKYINDNFFALQNITDAGNWVQFTPTTGNPAYPHLDHFGRAVNDRTDGRTQTLSNGTWIPMLRPYFGKKAHGDGAELTQFCPDDVPVEMLSFDGAVRQSAIDLFWETATEINNYGFYIERKAGNNDEWNSIGFVEGVGNSTTIQRYNFTDIDVQPGNTYSYRLRQVDRDGAQYCEHSDVITLSFMAEGDIVLEQNVPNPVKTNTTISYSMPEAANIKLEVLDIYGNVVNKIAEGFVTGGSNSVVFDGTDSEGNLLPSGTYIYRLSSGNKTVTAKMSIVR